MVKKGQKSLILGLDIAVGVAILSFTRVIQQW